MSGALDGVRLRFVTSLDTAMECRRWAMERRPGPLFFDTESGGLDPHRHRLRMIQLGDLRTGWAFPWEQWGGAALEILRDYPGELGAHHTAYDWRVLAVRGGAAPRWERTHDTMLQCHIADSVRPAALKPRAAMEIDSRAMAGEALLSEAKARQHWTWDTVPSGFGPYWTYAALDPVLAAHLHAKLSPEAAGRFGRSYDLERATARICAAMMTTGMMTDVPFIQARITELEDYYARAMAWLAVEHGITTVNSNEQVGAALNRAGIPTLAWTDGGKPGIGKEALKLYAHMFPQHGHLIRSISVCRKTDALVNRYLRKFLELRDSGDVIHYSINTCRARTSRQSVTDPPMQTFDRDQPMVRGAFIPRPGNVFISIDADQIEARLTAHFSRDPGMIADFRQADEAGVGYFIIAASRIYGTQITRKDPRYTWTKNATYGQIYGAGLEKVAVTAGVPLEEMRKPYQGFRQSYPRVAVLMNELIRQGKAGGRPQVLSWMGRRFYADRGHEYSLLNYKVQGSAAEVMKKGLADLDAAGFGPYLRLPVHDEILAEVPAEHAEEALRTATEILTNRTDFAVPLTWAGSVLPERWAKT